MRIKMKHRAYTGVANVLPEQQSKWEAAGWVAVPKPKKTTTKKDTTK